MLFRKDISARWEKGNADYGRLVDYGVFYIWRGVAFSIFRINQKPIAYGAGGGRWCVWGVGRGFPGDLTSRPDAVERRQRAPRKGEIGRRGGDFAG